MSSLSSMTSITPLPTDPVDAELQSNNSVSGAASTTSFLDELGKPKTGLKAPPPTPNRSATPVWGSGRTASCTTPTGAVDPGVDIAALSLNDEDGDSIQAPSTDKPIHHVISKLMTEDPARPKNATIRRKPVPYGILTQDDLFRSPVKAPLPAVAPKSSADDLSAAIESKQFDFNVQLQQWCEEADDLVNNSSFDTEAAEMVVSDAAAQSALWSGSDVREKVNFAYRSAQLVVFDVNQPPTVPHPTPAVSEFEFGADDVALPDERDFSLVLTTPAPSRPASPAATADAADDGVESPRAYPDESLCWADETIQFSTPILDQVARNRNDMEVPSPFSLGSALQTPADASPSAALATWTFPVMSPVSPATIQYADRAVLPATPFRPREMARDEAMAQLLGHLPRGAVNGVAANGSDAQDDDDENFFTSPGPDTSRGNLFLSTNHVAADELEIEPEPPVESVPSRPESPVFSEAELEAPAPFVAVDYFIPALSRLGTFGDEDEELFQECFPRW